MHSFQVEIRVSGNSETVLTETVQANNPIEALTNALERFKMDSRAADSTSWDVNVRQVVDG